MKVAYIFCISLLQKVKYIYACIGSYVLEIYYHARVALCRPTHKSACVSSLLLKNVTKSKEIQTLTSDLAAVINNSLVTSLQSRFQLIIMPFNLHGPEWL